MSRFIEKASLSIRMVASATGWPLRFWGQRRAGANGVKRPLKNAKQVPVSIKNLRLHSLLRFQLNICFPPLHSFRQVPGSLLYLFLRCFASCLRNCLPFCTPKVLVFPNSENMQRQPRQVSSIRQAAIV
mmetsp:Transcript_29330/g.77063  ORF Transcript_29330/g.77063 Transcript_29330/m.77063 type:complete len:129 (+) Transcript_29330:107-493(+)